MFDSDYQILHSETLNQMHLLTRLFFSMLLVRMRRGETFVYTLIKRGTLKEKILLKEEHLQF